MKALWIARKTLLELWREPQTLVLLLTFTIVLVGFYYLAFSGSKEGLSGYLTVMIINEDTGPLGANLVTLIRQTEYKGQPVFNVTPISGRATAEITLRERKAALLLTIPPDFSQTLLKPQSMNSVTPAKIELLGDPNTDTFVFAQSFLSGLMDQFVNDMLKRGPAVNLNYEFVPGTGTMSDFDFGVPGLLVFGVNMLVIITAQTLVVERVKGTLRRLRLTRAGAGSLLLGVALAQMAIVLVQIPITFGAALLMGFRGNGSLLLAMLVGLLLSLGAVGLGLITACFARNDGEAANLGAGVGVLMVLVSGAMFPMPAAPLFTLGGRTIQIYDFIPPTHAAEAMRRVLVLGEGIGSIWYQLTALTVLSAILLAVGVWLYQRLQMRG
jgi:ABC-2 type transport system permease protein